MAGATDQDKDALFEALVTLGHNAVPVLFRRVPILTLNRQHLVPGRPVRRDDGLVRTHRI